MEFSGRLAAFPIGDLLQWAHNDRRTGALVVRRREHEKRIYFEDGEVASCFSSDAAEFFGQHLLVNGLVDEATLVRALTLCQQEGRRLGEVLDSLGILRREAMLDALRRQIQELVCDVFLWRHGVFFFEAAMPPRAELLPETLSSVALAMEGARWRDEYERIRRVFVHDDVVLGPGTHFPGEGLTPLERRIVRAMRDEITVTELYELVGGSYFRFLEGAFGLAVREVLDIRDVGEDARSSSREIRLTEMLVEQAAEEQVLFFRGRLACPPEVMEKFYPVWVRPPAEPPRAASAAALRELWLAIDGETELGALFAGADAIRAQRIEQVSHWLREGALALLPVRVSELERSGPDDRRTPWWQRFKRSPRPTP